MLPMRMSAGAGAAAGGGGDGRDGGDGGGDGAPPPQRVSASFNAYRKGDALRAVLLQNLRQRKAILSAKSPRPQAEA